MNIQSMPIEKLGLSTRSANGLHRLKIHTVGDMLSLTPEKLFATRNMGQKSVNEILSKIEEIQSGSFDIENENAASVGQSESEDGEAINDEAVLSYIGRHSLTIDELYLLSVPAYNILSFSGNSDLENIIFKSKEELLTIPNMTPEVADEVIVKCKRFLRDHRGAILMETEPLAEDRIKSIAITELVTLPGFHDLILTNARKTDFDLEKLPLSVRALNGMRKEGYRKMSDIIFLTHADLGRIQSIGAKTAEEIENTIKEYLEKNKTCLLGGSLEEYDRIKESANYTIFEMVRMPEYHDLILENARKNDCELQKLALSKRTLNALTGGKYRRMSDIIFLTHRDLCGIRNLGPKSVEEIEKIIREYLTENELSLVSKSAEEGRVFINDDTVRHNILALYKEDGFRGYSLKEMMEALGLPGSFEESRLKRIIGSLLASGDLEYVDFRCYRLFEKFSDELDRNKKIDERVKGIVYKRLEGITLEGIAKDYDLTRERVRQIVNSTFRKVVVFHHRTTGKAYFDEDYYKYFYETYEIEKKDAVEWLGIPESVFRYFEMMGVKRGNTDINKAQEDNTGLDAGLRMKIRNYINRNKVFIDGTWVEKRRINLERIAARKLCRDQVSFDEFVKLYNAFLAEQDLDDEDLLITEGVSRTRLSRLADVRFILWSRGENLRYYDIDGQDYEELFRELHLDSYENIELSTWKLFHDNPEIMEKYDIRDHYELHNLLRKTVKNGSFHDFCCEPMPNIRFGEFDRDAALLDLIIEYAPIKAADLCSIIQETYGYDPGVTQSGYLTPLSEYYYQGMYTIDHKTMTAENMDKLLAALDDDFYYIDEIRKAYSSIVPDADLQEINSYNLKLMGFQVLSRYVIRNYTSLEAYFRSLLMDKEIVNMNPIKYRFRDIAMFYQTFQEIRKNLDLIEFEPDQYIGIRKLEKSGVTKDNLLDFCDEVFNAVNEGEYFSICSLRKRGFESELFDLGFSDMFYAGILQSDDRFFYSGMLGTTMFRLGKERLSIRSLVEGLVREEGSIDFIDLLSILNDDYGCSVQHRSDILLKIEDTDLYYDKTLDRLYMNVELFYREFDEAEGF